MWKSSPKWLMNDSPSKLRLAASTEFDITTLLRMTDRYPEEFSDLLCEASVVWFPFPLRLWCSETESPFECVLSVAYEKIFYTFVWKRKFITCATYQKLVNRWLYIMVCHLTVMSILNVLFATIIYVSCLLNDGAFFALIFLRTNSLRNVGKWNFSMSLKCW